MVAVFESFLDVFRKNSEIEHMFDLDLINETSQRAYMKRLAIDTVLNYVGRTISQSEFRFYDKGIPDKNEWYYKLNVKPNTDDSAANFWQKFIYKLIYDNEVLVIKTDTDDLLIADSYVRKPYALYEDLFTEVIVKDYEFQRPFRRSEVIFVEYNNQKLNKFMDGLFEDYGELLGRMIDSSLRNHQIRGKVIIDAKTNMDKTTGEKLQKFVNRLVKMFSTSAVAIFPQTKGFDYDEISAGERTDSQTFNDITKLKNELISEVAKAVGVPPKLVHGDVADLSESRTAYIEFCIKPLLEKIENELNAQLFDKSDFLEGSHVDVVGIDRPNIFELATAVDKLIGSGPFSPNEMRKELGYEPIDDPSMDKHYVTKNFSSTDELEGGDSG